eukprot:m.108001 g.108001  ORF g.108001 m.108001 type:complete len:605 (+) comp15858_c0_seq1:313-2127(+)
MASSTRGAAAAEKARDAGQKHRRDDEQQRGVVAKRRAVKDVEGEAAEDECDTAGSEDEYPGLVYQAGHAFFTLEDELLEPEKKGKATAAKAKKGKAAAAPPEDDDPKQAAWDKFWSKPKRKSTLPRPDDPFGGPVRRGSLRKEESLEDVLQLYFNEEVIKRLRVETNVYAARNQLDFVFTDEDIYGYLTIIFYAGLHNIDSCAEMFDADKRHSTDFCRQVMSRNRFQAIKRCISVANPDAATNTNDKLAKVRPFLDLVRDISQKNYRPQQHLALDETSLQCAHRNSRVSYRSQSHKIRRDFIKVICVNESGSAYLWDFLVDERIGVSTQDMVLRVLSRLPPGGKYTVATDRYYTSVNTAEELLDRDLYMYGTLRANGGLHSELKLKSYPDGFVKFFFSDRLMLCGWKDSGNVVFLSSFHGIERTTVARRQKGQANKVVRPAPEVAEDYNMHMGAGDQYNSLMERNFCIQVHQRRWYLSLMYYGLEALMINACVYHANLPHTSAQPMKEFRKAAVDYFFGKSRAAAAAPATAGQSPVHVAPHPHASAQLHHAAHPPSGMHVPTLIPSRGHCSACSMKTAVKCLTCNKFLCFVAERNCYLEFHSSL